MSSMYIWWLIFSCDLLCIRWCISWVCDSVGSSLLQIVMVIAHIQGRYLSGFSLQQSFSSCCQFPSPGFQVFLDKVYDFVGYFIHFETAYYPVLRDYIVCVFVVNPRHCNIFSSRFTIVEDVLINVLKISCSSCSLVASFLFFGK